MQRRHLLLSWKYLGMACVALAMVLAIQYVLPYTLVASPVAKVTLVDEAGKPLAGITIVRTWDTSENKEGDDKQLTDQAGSVSFERIEFQMSWLKRVLKPLLILVPASCGPGWEVYGEAKFDVYWPSGYTLWLDDSQWKKVDGIYSSAEGIHIYDPAQEVNKNSINFYVLNKKNDFDLKLKLKKATLN